MPLKYYDIIIRGENLIICVVRFNEGKILLTLNSLSKLTYKEWKRKYSKHSAWNIGTF